MTINCALDGPSGAGKSTIAKAVAKKLGYVYVDTGALYRSIGLYCTRNGIDISDSAAVEGVLSEIKVELKYVDGSQTVRLNGEDVSGLIRTDEISMAASAVSAIPAVRAFLLELQRSIARENDIVMDGRDIGTVILPNAQVKIFMTASAEERANRRYKELLERGQDVNYDDVLRDINQRDYNDSHRDISPLKKADDAYELDTSHMSIEEAVDAVVAGLLRAAVVDAAAGNDGHIAVLADVKVIVDHVLEAGLGNDDRDVHALVFRAGGDVNVDAGLVFLRDDVDVRSRVAGLPSARML